MVEGMGKDVLGRHGGFKPNPKWARIVSAYQSAKQKLDMLQDDKDNIDDDKVYKERKLAVLENYYKTIMKNTTDSQTIDNEMRYKLDSLPRNDYLEYLGGRIDIFQDTIGKVNKKLGLKDLSD